MPLESLLWKDSIIIRLIFLRYIIFFLIFAVLLPAETAGRDNRIAWIFTASLGSAWCPRTPLTIKQSGHQDLQLKAHYETHSLRFPLYYSLKFGKRRKQMGWEAEFVHLKIELRNRPGEIQRFEVSHGYNLLCLNFVRSRDLWGYHIGTGIVVTHPENEIRRQKLSQPRGMSGSGYYLSGPVVQAGVSKVWKGTQSPYCVLEGKISAAYSKIPVSNGWAMTPVIALQGLLGFELRYVR